MNSLKLKENIYWVGVKDPKLRVFDIIMHTEFGTTYNSYVVKGSEKTAIFETVKIKFYDDYIKKLKETIGIENIDYIIVDHTEPDHVGSLEKLLQLYPNAKVVGSETAIRFLKQIVNKDFEYLTVGDGDSLSLGDKTLEFINAPFLHWPDSIYTYLKEDNILFTCDSFGAHYSFEGVLHSEVKNESDYKSALEYYYNMIFGPFKKHLLDALAKIKDLKIDMICNGHGPILDDNIEEIIKIYTNWSIEKNPNKKKTVIIPYVSAYGYTAEIASEIAKGIKDTDGIDVETYDLLTNDLNTILDRIYWADGLLLGSPTINGAALKPIHDLTSNLFPIVHGDKIASAFGSYGWSGEAVPNLVERLAQLRMKTMAGLKVTFKGSEEELKAAYDFGVKFANAVITGDVEKDNDDESDLLMKLNPTGKIKKWRCIVCGEVFEGVLPPITCPACGVGQDQFEEYEEQIITHQNDSQNKILIIGNNAAGISAAEAIRKRDKTCELIIYTKDEYQAYYRPSVSDYITEEMDVHSLYLREESWYSENKINVSLSKEIISIDSDNKTITFLDGSHDNYDKLILANGSECALPPIQNSCLPGVFRLKTYTDAITIKAAAKQAKNAVVIGGGVLGLEAASELKELGLNVEIVEMVPRILPRQLDEEGSHILEERIKAKGIKVHKNHLVKKILGDKKVSGVELESGMIIDADIIIISAGIKPNSKLAKDAGLRTNRGVIVDEYMKTVDENIYAAGDVAEFDGLVFGIWAVAIEQGKVAGANAVGDNLKYEAKQHPVSFIGMDTQVFSIGNISTDDIDDVQENKYFDTLNGIYKKVYFKDNKFLGGILIGDISKAGVLLNAISNDEEPSKILKKLYV